jgi:uncharacterized phage-associated protein
MAARLDSVCKYICERGQWRVTNLQLQKLLYMAQMLHMGRNHGERLVAADFEAWDYGPVTPSLYHKVKMFGNAPVEDVFFEARNFKQDDYRRKILDEVCDNLLHKRPGELVDITHWSEGAWAKHYVPGSRYISIPDDDIAVEYHARLQRQRSRDLGVSISRPSIARP